MKSCNRSHWLPRRCQNQPPIVGFLACLGARGVGIARGIVVAVIVVDLVVEIS